MKRQKLTIDTLILYLNAHPDLHQKIREKFVNEYGPHFVSGQSGEHKIALEVEIKDVKIIPEAVNAIETALSLDLIEEGQQGTAAFYDIGMRSAICYLVNLGHNKGPRIIKASRRPFDGYGLYRLLSLIAEDPDTRKKYSEMSSRQGTEDGLRTPDPFLILEGIKKGTYRYGSTGLGFNFRAVYDKYAQSWLSSIVSEPLSIWRTAGAGWTDNIVKSLFFGGGASIARPLIEARQAKGDEFFGLVEPTILHCEHTLQLANIAGGILSESGVVYAIDSGSGDIKCARRGARGFTEAVIFESVFGPLYDPDLEARDIGDDGVVLHYERGPGSAEGFWTMFGEETPNICKGNTKRLLDATKIAHLVQTSFAGILKLHLEEMARGFGPSNGNTPNDVIEEPLALSMVEVFPENDVITPEPNHEELVIPKGRNRNRNKAKITGE